MTDSAKTAPAGWHYHVNGGGLVQNTAYVSPDAWVSGDAQVFGYARVFGYAQVYGNARVFGYAQVYGNAQVFGDARVSGYAQVSGDAQVSGSAQVMWGCCYPYNWTAWVDGDGMYHLAIGCEVWPLEWWPALAADLSVQHDSPVPAALIEPLAALIAARFDYAKEVEAKRAR